MTELTFREAVAGGTAPNLIRLATGARVFDLAQRSHANMPQLPGAPRFLLNLLRRHGDVYREDGLSAANELLVTICHAGTHIDAIGHISVDGVLHGGILAQDAQIGTAGLQHLDIDSVAPIVRRGVLLDVAGMLGVPALAPAQGIDAAMLADAANRAQVTIEPGDAVLVRTGWGAFWDEPDRYVSLTEGLPGPNLNGARWLVERGITLTGADCLMYEAFHLARNALPVHAFLLQQHGVYLVENMLLETLAQANVTEFLLIILPLRLAGATGSPIRPIALA